MYLGRYCRTFHRAPLIRECTLRVHPNLTSHPSMDVDAGPCLHQTGHVLVRLFTSSRDMSVVE